MVDLRRRGTRWNVFGITTHETFELDGGYTHFLEGRMDASFGTTPLAMTKAIRLMERGLVPVERIISHRFPLAQIHEALDGDGARRTATRSSSTHESDRQHSSGPAGMAGAARRPSPARARCASAPAPCGICATDLEMIAGWDRTGFPTIPGHEWAGIVDAVGPGVDPASPANTAWPRTSWPTAARWASSIRAVTASTS